MPNVHPQSPFSTIAPDNLSTTGKIPVRTEERIMELVFVSCSFLLSGLLFFYFDNTKEKLMSPALNRDGVRADTPYRHAFLFSRMPHTAKESWPPAAVLPEQFYAKPEDKTVSQGIQALMHAVLDDALWMWKKQFLTTGRKTQRLAREAEEWFFSEDESWPFSFVNICASLGLDPSYIRRGIHQWQRRPPVRASRAKGHPVFVNRSCKLAA